VKKKPKGRKYQGLFARPETSMIWFEKVVDGRRYRESCGTDQWDEAAEVFAEWRLQRRRAQSMREIPGFADLADRYLETTTNLAATTRDDRMSMLRPGSEEKREGALRAFFGRQPIDEIRRPMLIDWWHQEIEQKGRAYKTGKNYLDALSGVFAVAVDYEILDANPVDGFRGYLRRRNRTQRGRAGNDSRANRFPIEHASEVDAFVAASRMAGGPAHIVDLLCLDAGLRLGEATALRWEDCVFGVDAADTTRAVCVRVSRSRGVHLGTTKSGRERVVAMSRRLRSALLAFQMEQGRPQTGPIAWIDHANYRRRHFKNVCQAAQLAPVEGPAGSSHARTPKDLRDTFASQLITAGIQLGYVSQQLGHSDVSVTARHYAKWAGGDTYWDRLEVDEDEVPADLLARLSRKSPQKSPQSSKA
jgi:integrase